MDRGGFPFLNRFVNPLVRLVLRSPLGRVVGGRVLLITYTGRRSGRTYTIPTEYQRPDPGRIVIPVGWPSRKLWWRNLTGAGASVTLRVKGRELEGHAVASGDESKQVGGVRVDIRLGA